MSNILNKMTIQWRPPKGMVIIGLIVLFTYLGTFKLIGSVPINNNDTQSIHHQLAQSSNVNNHHHHQHHNDYQTITFETIDRWRRRRTKRSSYILGRRRTPTYYSNKYGHNTTNPHFLEPWQANPNYWIPDRYHENVVCLLAQFSGIVRVRPSNTTFRGGTFMVSPEDSLGRRSNCERNSRNIFWKFSQVDDRLVNNDDDNDDDDDDDDNNDDDNNNDNNNVMEKGDETNSRSKGSITTSTMSTTNRRRSRLVMVERSKRMLSAGFHVVGSGIEFHIAYIECLQQADKNILTDRYRVYGNGVCVNLSVSFEIGSFGDRLAYECNYIWSKSLRDIHYNHNRRFYAGEVQISLKMVRIDKDPIGQAPYAFRRSRRRCAWDSVFGWQSLVILVTFLSLFIFGFLGLCVCSNLTCNGGTSPTNWCCSPFCFCCHLCSNRRRRARRNNRPTQSRALLIRNNNNRNHHHPPPPPPPSQLHLHLLQQQRQQHQQQPNGIIDRSNVLQTRTNHENHHPNHHSNNHHSHHHPRPPPPPPPPPVPIPPSLPSPPSPPPPPPPSSSSLSLSSSSIDNDGWKFEPNRTIYRNILTNVCCNSIQQCTDNGTINETNNTNIKTSSTFTLKRSKTTIDRTPRLLRLVMSRANLAVRRSVLMRRSRSDTNIHKYDDDDSGNGGAKQGEDEEYRTKLSSTITTCQDKIVSKNKIESAQIETNGTSFVNISNGENDQNKTEHRSTISTNRKPGNMLYHLCMLYWNLIIDNGKSALISSGTNSSTSLESSTTTSTTTNANTTTTTGSEQSLIKNVVRQLRFGTQTIGEQIHENHR